jgi:hypothetical protein
MGSFNGTFGSTVPDETLGIGLIGLDVTAAASNVGAVIGTVEVLAPDNGMIDVDASTVEAGAARGGSGTPDERAT